MGNGIMATKDFLYNIDTKSVFFYFYLSDVFFEFQIRIPNHISKSYPSSGLFLLLQLSDVVLHDVGPEVALKVGQLGRRLDVVLQRLLVDVLVVQDDPLDDALVQDLFVPFLGK